MLKKKNKRDILAIQRSIYAAITALMVAKYHTDFLGSQNRVFPMTLTKEKKSRRLGRIIKEIRIDLLESVKSESIREEIKESLNEERITSISSILMMINNIQDLDQLEKFENFIEDILIKNKNKKEDNENR